MYIIFLHVYIHLYHNLVIANNVYMNQIFLLYTSRGYELLLLYNVIITRKQEFCPVSNQTDIFNCSKNESNEGDGNDVEKFTNVAKYMTFYSVCFEVGVGYLTWICFLIKFPYCTKGYSCAFACGGFARNRWCLCYFHSEKYMEAFSKTITPFLMIRRCYSFFNNCSNK